MNLNFLRRQAIISSQARKRDLPYLCELEYLESTGEQWITIPYKIVTTDTFRHETANQYTQFGTNQYEGQTSGGNWYGIDTSGKYTIGSGIVSSFTASTNEFDSIIAESDETGLTLTVNGNIVGTRSSKSSGQKVYLFDCYNPNATATGNYYNFVRKKYHRLYVNGSLFFDGIPVLDYDMKPAMYDRVTKTFFYNEGTGEDFKFALKRGDKRAYTELEYLESTGEQYIDIGYQLQTTDTVKHVVTQQYAYKSTAQYENHVTAPRYFGVNYANIYTVGGTDVGIKSSTNDYDNIVFEGTPTQGTVVVNGTVAASRVINVSRSLNIYIFGACGSSNELQYPCYVKKKSHQIYVNDVLIFDGIPVLDYLLRPAMFDKVSGKFFYNKGTGADFKYGLKDNAGNLYTSVPYIESTGGAMITLNIPVVKTQTVKHVCRQQYMSTTGRQLEGFAQGGRWFGTNEGYWHITSSTKSDVMSSTDDYDKIIFNSTPTKQNLVVNNTEVCRTQTAVVQDNVGIRLFAAGGGSYPCNIRKKFHLIYVDNKLVFAGVPVVNTNGVAGLFDVITKTMFKNAFTGEFLIGE